MKPIHKFIEKIKIKLASNDDYIKILRKKGMKLGTGCSVAKSLVIGDEPFLITLGNNVRVTRNVQLITHDGGIWTLRHMGLASHEDVLYGRIVIGDNTNIGWNAVILPGVKIGKNCIIGANAVVTKDIPDNSVAVGMPARVIESVEEYYEKHHQLYVPTFSMTKSEKCEYLMKHRPELFEDN